jgi:monofunctional biosynthetic peptidoglycan transglycosylase
MSAMKKGFSVPKDRHFPPEKQGFPGTGFGAETARMRKKKRLRYWLFVRIPFWFVLLSLALVFMLKWVPVRVTPLMVRRSVQFARVDDFHTRQDWKPLKEISPEMVKAVIASEDNRFGEHNGFDWKEFGLMWKEHFERGKDIRGCSTISQQTAKNVFTWGTQTWVRKAFEWYWTFLIESIWGKERIMEVYLNVVETGRGIYGVEAAAREYYGCHAAGLTRFQAVAIAVCLPSPLKYSPVAPTPYLRNRQKRIGALIPKVKYPEWI